MKHAKLSASGAHRWLNCPGSVNAERGIKEGRSPHAEEGSAAHELGEKALISGKPCSDYIGTTFKEWKDWPVTQEMADFVQIYVDFVNSFDGEAMIENRVHFDEWVPEGFGTSDAIVVNGDNLHVIDLKYGQGVQVFAEENPQGMLYALGAYALTEGLHKIKTVDITIVQPRLDHIDTWRISLKDLLKWGNYVRERAELALTEDAPREPGDKQCHWCKAKATCPALKKMTDDIVMAFFDDPVDTLSDDDLANALSSKKLIIGWLDAVESLAKQRLSDGEGFPGYKLVAGRTTRKWADTGEACDKLLTMLEDEQVFETKAISPAKAEKLLGKAKAAEIQGLIASSTGAPTLVPESDKRPAINISVDDF